MAATQDAPDVAPEPIEPIWSSKIVGLSVMPRATAVVPIVVSEPSVFNYKLHTNVGTRLAFTQAETSESVHDEGGFRQMASGDFRCIGSFTCQAGVVNVTFESASAQRAVVDGTVRIEPLRQVRPYTEYQRRLVLQAAIASRQRQQQERARDAAECASREQRLRTTLLELQQAVEIAAQELAENEQALASHCEASVKLSEEIEHLQQRLSCTVDGAPGADGEHEQAGSSVEAQ